MPESEFVKMCAVMIPTVIMIVSVIIGGIIEEIGNYKNKDCFKDEEAQDILKKCREELK